MVGTLISTALSEDLSEIKVTWDRTPLSIKLARNHHAKQIPKKNKSVKLFHWFHGSIHRGFFPANLPHRHSILKQCLRSQTMSSTILRNCYKYNNSKVCYTKVNPISPVHSPVTASFSGLPIWHLSKLSRKPVCQKLCYYSYQCTSHWAGIRTP